MPPGALKAGIPLEMASIPVSVAHPEAKALNMINMGNIFEDVSFSSLYWRWGIERDFVKLAPIRKSRLPIKRYTGIEKILPDSLTPLRFIIAINSMASTTE